MAVTLSLSITQNSQNIANNSSNITVKVNATCTVGSWSGYSRSGYLTIDGTRYDFSSTFNLNASYNWSGTLFQKTVDVVHTADGTKSCYVYAWFSTGVSSGNISTNTTKTLTTIPRASSFGTITGDTLGSSMQVNITRASTSFTHTLWGKYGNSPYYLLAENVATQHTFTPSIELASQYPNMTSGTMTLKIQTYSGTTAIGSAVTKDITVKIPTTVVPIISSVTITDPTNNSTTFGKFVQGRSKIKVAISASGAYGSTIKSTSIELFGETKTVNPYESDVISASGSQTISIVVTDSRGRTAITQRIIDIYPYSVPTITKLGASRCNEDGTSNDEGAFIYVNYGGSITSLGEQNNKRIIVKYKKQTEPDTAYTNAVNVQEYERDTYVIFPADINSTYDINFSLQDSFETVDKHTLVSTAFTLIDYYDGGVGDGIAFGKVAEKSGIEVALPLDLHTDVTFDSGEQTSQRAIAFGNANGENPHHCTLYGGNPNSETAIGLRDMNANDGAGRDVLSYDDVNNDIHIGDASTGISFEGKFRTSLLIEKETTPTVSISNGTRQIALHIGSGGNNRGIYDMELGKWMVYEDSNGNVSTPSPLIVEGHKSKIGSNDKFTDQTITLQSSSGTTYTEVGSLDIGTYVVIATVIFGANASGFRYVSVNKSNTSNYQSSVQVSAAPSGLRTYINVSAILDIAEDNTKIYVAHGQNSGSALSTEIRCTYVRIS